MCIRDRTKLLDATNVQHQIDVQKLEERIKEQDECTQTKIGVTEGRVNVSGHAALQCLVGNLKQQEGAQLDQQPQANTIQDLQALLEKEKATVQHLTDRLSQERKKNQSLMLRLQICEDSGKLKSRGRCCTSGFLH